MENEKLDAIDRALIFLVKATYANYGAGVDVRIVPADKDDEQERG